MTAAPHLPPKTCAIIGREISHTLKWLAVVIVLAVLGGMTAALFVVDSWYPTATIGNTTMVFGRNGRSVAAPDANVVREWRERLVHIYDQSQVLGSGFFKESSELGQAVVLSSSGWAVMLPPVGVTMSRRQLVGIDSDGKSHAVEKLLSDTRHNLLYLKLSGSEFRATTVFGDSETLRPGDSLWSLNDEWMPITVDETRFIGQAPYQAGEPTTAHGLIGSELYGRIIVSSRGEFLGIADDENTLVPAWIIAGNVPDILTSGALAEQRFDWRGYFVVGAKDGLIWRDVSGFYIVDARSQGVIAKIKIGDVITQVNGQKVTKENLAKLLASAPSQFRLIVSRDGKDVEVEARKND